MPGPHPAVAAIRGAVRRHFASGWPNLVLVGCSGGPDSLALAAAVAFESAKAGASAGAVIIDHQLQEGSALVADRAARSCRDFGLAPVQIVAVEVDDDSSLGPEGAAREARRAALGDAARELGASAVLLGHTEQDQAETVLLGVARGSGNRSLSGMAADAGLWQRPLLGITREQTRSACHALGMQPWNDPHNDDPRFTRVRARQLLHDLERALGPGVVSGLARTAQLARQDADSLESLAAAAAAQLGQPPWQATQLAQQPVAIRTRVWRLLMHAAGASTPSVSSTHVGWLESLVTDWHGQGPIDIPGGLQVSRNGRMIDVRGSSG